jgi:ABC-2 type transport system permease protein
MLNLILKDILIQKKTLAFIGLYIIFFMYAFQSIGAGAFSAIIIAVTYQMVASACNHEHKSNSDIVMNSLPLTRKSLVLSKYLSIIIYASLATLGYMAFYVILQLVPISINIQPVTLESLAAALVGVILMNGIYYPVYFSLGYTKAQIVSFLLFFVFFFGSMSIAEILTGEQKSKLLLKVSGFLSKSSDMQIFLMLMGGALVILFISYTISVRFYSNREF